MAIVKVESIVGGRKEAPGTDERTGIRGAGCQEGGHGKKRGPREEEGWKRLRSNSSTCFKFARSLPNPSGPFGTGELFVVGVKVPTVQMLCLS